MDSDIPFAQWAEGSVYIIDDDEFTLKLIDRNLQSQGFSRIFSYTSGREALAAFDRAKPHPALILLDLNMPVMDGIEFVRYLVARQYKGGLILISGEDERMLTTATKMVEANRIAILGSLQKPVTLEALGQVLSRWRPNTRDMSPTPRNFSADELRLALEQDAFINYYQPKINLATGAIAGVEALTRWLHPEGMVQPNEFIPLMERYGLMSDQTYQLLQWALRDYHNWQAQGLSLPLAINLSMDSLSPLDFADRLAEAVSQAGVLPKDITLEITETKAIENPAAVFDNLTRLKLKRFVLAIDDFGTGYSSLSQLRDVPFEEFKIDRSFVYRAWANNSTKAMFENSLNLASQLNMKVVAEGIETREDWEFVRKSGCHCGQGFFIARPMPAADIPAWVELWNERMRPSLYRVTEPPAPKPVKSGTADGGEKTVLIIEDHEFQRRIQSKILREEGFQIVAATNGMEALNLLRSLRPQLIMLDMALPDIDGLQVIRRLRATKVFRHTPIIIVSGANQKDVVMECIKAGANAFIAKPFDRQTFVDKVKITLKAIAGTKA